MQFRVIANNTNGNLPGLDERFETIDQAKKHADWWHGQSAVCNVEIDELLGVQLTRANGTKEFGRANDLDEAMDVRESWQGVIDNRKINRSRVTKAEIVGLRHKTAVATPEDAFVGKWMAEALDDPKVLPSMKYDINRWMDSKEWV
ncbi:hypothetical protein HOV23_gp068 [Pseudomonas phage Lana]|uniref:Uncharacterized protein n=1 Tax=Pseudomonas phage Lana TaxID=2530172 RepID=A0A481W6A4_9CAUD|nr:hypothetical protein HOV23_gp068 [Pseudomonas phage Lana]QBJ04505.1 hypothetical protein [Pseudomonas phage Lana]